MKISIMVVTALEHGKIDWTNRYAKKKGISYDGNPACLKDCERFVRYVFDFKTLPPTDKKRIQETTISWWRSHNHHGKTV